MSPTIDLSPEHWKQQPTVKKDGQWTVDGRPVVSIQLTQHRNPPNMPDKTWLTLVVTAPPGAATPPHTHNHAAVMATMIRGRMLNQMVHPAATAGVSCHGEDDASPKIYAPGDSWYEAPGCHHVRSENVGEEEAQFVANLVIETDRLQGAVSGWELLGKVFIIDADVEARE